MTRLKRLLLVIVVVMLAVPRADVRGQATFSAPELLGRPTHSSITVNVVAATAIDAYVRYGTEPGV